MVDDIQASPRHQQIMSPNSGQERTFIPHKPEAASHGYAQSHCPLRLAMTSNKFSSRLVGKCLYKNLLGVQGKTPGPPV